MNEQKPTQQQQQIENFMLSDYIKKRDAGIITFERDNGVVVMVHKQFDSIQSEIEPLRMAFSATQMEKIRLGRDQQKLQLRSQIIDLKQKLETIEREDAILYNQLENDVQAASEEDSNGK